MYPISNIMADYLRRHDQEFRVKATINGQEYADSKIVDFKVEDRLTLSDGFEIGTAIPSKLTFRIRAAEEIEPNAQIVPYVALSLASMTWLEANISWDDNPLPWTGGATEWLPLGEFYVDNRDKVNDVWEYSCFDKLVFADQPYISSLTYPTTQQAVVDEICGRLGYTYDGSVVINPAYIVPIAPTGFSMRQVLGYIAGANCGSFFMGKDGTLKMKRFVPDEQPVFDLGMADYIRARQTNPLKSYSRVVVTYDTEDNLTYESGEGDENHTLTMENPLVTQAIADALCASLSGVSYLPLTMDAKGYPQLEQGDRIGIGLYEGTSWMETLTPWMETEIPWTGVVQHQSYILHQVFTFRGGLLMSIESPAVSEQKSEFKVPGTLSEAVDKLDKTSLKEGKRYYGVTTTRTEGIKVQTDAGAYSIFNADELSFYDDEGNHALWFDSINKRYQFSGTLIGVDGEFSGNLSAATGTFAGDLSAAGGTFEGTLVGVDGTFIGTLQGGKIISDTDVDITRDARIGNNLFMGLAGALNDRRIEFVDPSIYEAFISYTASNSSNELKIRAGNDLRLSSGLYLSLDGMVITLNGDSYVGSNTPGNRIVTASELDAIYATLDGKASASHSHSVTIPSHNHGNPANANSGGGTFTVT